MPPSRWRLERFQDGLNRWVATSHPPDSCIAQTAQWITERLPLDPQPPGSRRYNGDPRQRYVILPFRSNEGRFPLIAWHIETDTRTLLCMVLEEIDERQRP
jgi:hypothetical protein